MTNIYDLKIKVNRERISIPSEDFIRIIEDLHKYAKLLVSDTRHSMRATDTVPGRTALLLVRDLGYSNTDEFLTEYAR